jgi:hypothetical protein
MSLATLRHTLYTLKSGYEELDIYVLNTIMLKLKLKGQKY